MGIKAKLDRFTKADVELEAARKDLALAVLDVTEWGGPEVDENDWPKPEVVLGNVAVRVERATSGDYRIEVQDRHVKVIDE